MPSSPKPPLAGHEENRASNPATPTRGDTRVSQQQADTRVSQRPADTRVSQRPADTRASQQQADTATSRPSTAQADVPEQAATAPRLPHEHDESADNQTTDTASQQEIGRQAYADLEHGLKDTGREPALDQVYDEHLRGRNGTGESEDGGSTDKRQGRLPRSER